MSPLPIPSACKKRPIRHQSRGDAAGFIDRTRGLKDMRNVRSVDATKGLFSACHYTSSDLRKTGSFARSSMPATPLASRQFPSALVAAPRVAPSRRRFADRGALIGGACLKRVEIIVMKGSSLMKGVGRSAQPTLATTVRAHIAERLAALIGHAEIKLLHIRVLAQLCSGDRP